MAEEKEAPAVIGEPNQITFPACNTCKHYETMGVCAAFKQRIPTDILVGDNPHAIPIPGQKNDIVWTAKG